MKHHTMALLLFLLLLPAAVSVGAQKLVRFNRSVRCGFDGRSVTVVVEPQYENCGDYSSGLAAVQIGSR